MKKLKLHNPVRDILFAFALIILIKPALHLSAKRLRDKNRSIQSTNFSVHELDPKIIKTFERTKEQLNGAIALTRKKNDIGELKRLEQLSYDLGEIKEKYTKNSPGMMFLGPFATASIIIKELEVEDELNRIVGQMGPSPQRSIKRTASTSRNETEILAKQPTSTQIV